MTSVSDPEITIAITCYNEAPLICETIENVAAAIREVGRSFEIIVIDDVSRDDSAARVRAYLAQHPELPARLHVNPENQGLANNFVNGAFMGRGEYYRLCCGDNSEPSDALLRIFRHIGHADMVLPYKGYIPGKGMFRNTISRLYSCIINVLSGRRIQYYNGMPVFRRIDVMRYPPVTLGFGYQADIVTRLLDEGRSYAQVYLVGITEEKGMDKSTALNTRNMLSVMHTMLEIVLRRARRMILGKEMAMPRQVPALFPEED